MKKQNIFLITIIVILAIASSLFPLIKSKYGNKVGERIEVNFNSNYYNDANTHMFFMDGNHQYVTYDNKSNFYGDPNSFRKIENKEIELNLFNNDKMGFQLVSVTDNPTEYDININGSYEGIEIQLYEEGLTKVGDISFLHHSNFSFNDYLIPAGDSVVLDGVKVFWIEIITSPELEVGNYNFEIIFSNRNQLIKNKFNINSNGIELKNESNRVNSADYFFNPSSYYDENIKFMDENYKMYQEPILKFKKEFGEDFLFTWGANRYPDDMKEYWFNNTITGLIKWIKKVDGTFEFDFKDLDNYMEWGKSLGFKNIMLTGLTVSLDYGLNIFGYYDQKNNEYTKPNHNFNSAEYKKAMDTLINELVNHFRDTVWNGHIYLIMDEPIKSSVDYWINKLNEIDQNNVLKTMLHAGWKYLFDYKDKEQYNFLIENIDVLTFGQYALINFGNNEKTKKRLEELVEKRKKNGFKTYIYSAGSGKGPGTLIEEDYGDSMYWQIATKILGLDGEYFWALNKWNFENMFDITNAKSERFALGDSFKIYPKKDADGNLIPGVTKSIRMMQVMNGIKIAEKIDYIQKNDQKLFEKIYNKLIYYNQLNFSISRDIKYKWYFKGIGKIQKNNEYTSTTNVIEINELTNIVKGNK